MLKKWLNLTHASVARCIVGRDSPFPPRATIHSVNDLPTPLSSGPIDPDSEAAWSAITDLANHQIDEEFKISERLDAKLRSIAQIGLIGFGVAQTVLIGSVEKLREASLSTTQVAALGVVSVLALVSAIALAVIAIFKLRHKNRAAIEMNQIRDAMLPYVERQPSDATVTRTLTTVKVRVAADRQAENKAAANGQGLFVGTAVVGIVLAAIQIAAVSVLVAFS